MAKTSQYPVEFGTEGRRLWREYTAGGNTFELAERQALIHACLLADDIARFRNELRDQPSMVTGAYKNLVENPLIGSIRQATALQHKLLASIVWEDQAAAPSTSASAAGTALNRKRWS